ncbi:MAG TPA: cyclodeaminase/cyclohydrolase family protein [Candidatus Baltobacteraceae bacterium]|nr:cyclodeaminase/cyclohydrolase family protein [Candidatus Baltobacteraceae bacterium]
MESLDRYLTELASANPTPGGGSAATIVGALGAALVAMVARIDAGNPKYAEHREAAVRIVETADRVRAELDAARDRDELAFSKVVNAQNLPKVNDEEKAVRARLLESALRDAAEVPLKACELCIAVLRLAAQAAQIPNRSLASDVGCAAEFGAAALAACAYNVRVNHRYMRDPSAIETQADALGRYENEASSLLEVVRRDVSAALR